MVGSSVTPPFSIRDAPIVLDDDDDDVHMAAAPAPTSLAPQPSPSASLRDMTPAVSISTISSNGNGQTIANGSSQLVSIDTDDKASPFDRYRTGYVFSADMMLHVNPIDPNHPEQPLRIWEIYRKFKANKLFERMKRIPIREVLEDEVKLVHDQGIWDGVWTSACKFPFAKLAYMCACSM